MSRSHMRDLSSQHSQHGFNLIEAMVSVVVLSVGMIGIASLYTQGLGAGRTALYRTIAVNLASDMADRIRANRTAGVAYGGAAADSNCDPGDNKDCTPAEMAAHDLWLWNAQVVQQLPNGVGQVRFAGGTPPTYTIQITWQEVGLGATTETIAIQVPDL